MKNTVHTALQKKKLDSLKNNFIGGVFAKKQKQQKERQLRMLIKNALFLQRDKDRKKKWMSIVADLSVQKIEQLIDAIVRENLRYKKHERNVVVELNSKNSHISFS